jgi:RNA polymerase sigma-70 factor (ECF subfamily)
VAKHRPIRRSCFTQWARGRLPATARDLAETEDLVQITLLRALEHIDGFEPRREGAFLAYLRRILMNEVRDEIRRASRRPRREKLADNLPGGMPSPLEDTLSRENLAAYESALARLPQRTRDAVILRLEFGFDYQAVAEAIGAPTANASRMLITRALVQMAEAMNGTGG